MVDTIFTGSLAMLMLSWIAFLLTILAAIISEPKTEDGEDAVARVVWVIILIGGISSVFVAISGIILLFR